MAKKKKQLPEGVYTVDQYKQKQNTQNGVYTRDQFVEAKETGAYKFTTDEQKRQRLMNELARRREQRQREKEFKSGLDRLNFQRTQGDEVRDSFEKRFADPVGLRDRTKVAESPYIKSQQLAQQYGGKSMMVSPETALNRYLSNLAQKQAEVKANKDTYQGYETWKTQQNNQAAINRNKTRKLAQQETELDKKAGGNGRVSDQLSPDSFNRYVSENYYDDNDTDPRRWSNDKLQQEIDTANNRINELKSRKDTDKEALKTELNEIKNQRGVYTNLDVNGILDTDDLQTYLRQRPEDYYNNEWKTQHYDQMLYDAIHGDGSYQARVDALETDEEANELDAEVADLWDKLEKQELHTIPMNDDELNAREESILEDLFASTDKDEKYLKNLQGVQSARDRQAELEANAPEGMFEKPERVFEYKGNNPLRFALDRMGGGSQIKDKADETYWAIKDQQSKWAQMSSEEQLNMLKDLGYTDFQTGLADSFYNTGRAQKMYYAFLDPDMVDVFDRYYESGDKDSAMAYLEAIEQTGYLNYKAAKYKEFTASENAQGPYGAVYGLTTILEQPQASAIGLAAAAMSGFDVKEGSLADKLGLHQVTDEYDPILQAQRNINATRQGRSEWYGDKASELLGEWAREPAKFMTNVAYSLADNWAAMGVGKAVSGADIDKCMRAVQLIMSGSATSSKLLEKLGENRDPGEAALSAIGDGIIEWVTERFSLESLLKPDIKGMLGNGKQVAKYLAKVTAAEGSEEIASDILNLGWDTMLSMIYDHENEIEEKYNALVDGGMDPKEALNTVWTDKFKEIGLSGLAGSISGLASGTGRYAINSVGQYTSGKNVNVNKNTQRLVEVGAGMKSGTMSNELATKLNEEIRKGKKPSNVQLGKLAQLMVQETSEEQGQVIKDTIEQNVRNELEAQGVENAKEAAQVISKSLFEGTELTKADQQILAQDEKSIETWRQYNSVSPEQTALQMDITEKTAPQRSLIDTVSELTSSRAKSVSVLAKEVDRSIRETKSAEEALDNLQTRLPSIVSEKFVQKAKEILSSDKTAQKNTNYLDDVMKIRMAAMTLDRTIPMTRLSDKAAQQLFDAAREEFNEKDQQRVLNQVKVEPGKGVVTFDGAEYGTPEWNSKLRSLIKQQRNQMGALGEIVTRLGNRLNLINDPKNPGVYGFEQSDGTITINVAGMNRNGLNHHMLVTMSHELTHWLEQNSAEGYNQLRQYVLDSLRSKGQNIAQLVVDTINNQNAVLGAESGNTLDINGAMAEIVAKSSENLLRSEAVRNEIAETNPSLYNKIKTFVKDFTARVRQAVQGMTGSLSREARTLLGETDRIAELWMSARKEALGREVIGEVDTEGKSVNFSMVQLNNYNSVNEDEKTKVTRIENNNTALMNAVTALNDPGPFTTNYIQNKLKGVKSHNFTQWIREKYGNAKGNVVTLSAIQRFIDQDNAAIKKGARSLTDGWNKIKDKTVEATDITNTTIIDDKVNIKQKRLKNEIFGKKGYLIAENKNTSTFIRADNLLIEETFANNKINPNTIEKVLKNTKTLLEKAVYIGSHPDYLHNNGEIHYYATPIDVNNSARVVMYAVHEAIDNNQKKLFNKRAYVASITIAKQNGVTLASWTHISESGFTSGITPKVSIGNLIEVVNDDRFRSYDPEKLKNKKVQAFSVQNLDDQYDQAVRDGDTYAQTQLVRSAAKQAGAITNERGVPIKLYHGTRRFGFTVFDTSRSKFDTGAIFTTSSESVANGYSEFGQNRKASGKYVEDDGTDRTIIRNAKNVLNFDVERLSEEKAQEIRSKFLEKAKKLAAIEEEAMNESQNYSPPDEINTEFWQVVQAMSDLLNEDKYLFDEDEEYRKNYIHNSWVVNEDQQEMWEKVRDYFYNNDEAFRDLKENGKGFYNLLYTGYDHSDAIIEEKYTYKNLLDLSDKFINKANGSIYEREALQDIIERSKGQGNYTLYGFAGDKPLVIDAGKSHWTAITAPMIGDGYYTTDYIVKWAKNNGYTSVIIKNVMDPGVVNEYGDDYVFFNSNQLKSAEPIEYDDNDVPIPPSERFNLKENDIRYSVEQSPDMDVDNFMLGLNEFHLDTVQEKTMLRQYKDLHATVELTRMKIREREAMLRKLEEKRQKEGKLSAYDREEVRKINNWLTNDRNKLDRVEKELVKVTGEKGYARLMMQQDSLMRNLVNGVTADQLISIVDEMNRQLDEVNGEMQKRAAELDELAQKEAVLRIRQQFNQTGLKRIAAKLKSELNSSLENKEIENRLALIALKMAEGKYDAETAEQLTDMILGKMRGGYDSYVLQTLRGRTIALSEAQLKELKAKNSSLREINAELAGTGIRITAKGNTNLEHIWGELSGEITSLEENTPALEQLDALMNLVRSEKNTMFAERFNDESVQATTEAVLNAAAELLPEITTDEKSLKLIRETLKFVGEVSAQAKQTAGQISDMGSMIDRIKKTGAAARSGANKLTGDVGTAIRYFNTLAEQSEAALWKKERVQLIEQLKSENTENLLKEQEKWKQKIEKDKAAREKMESNLQLRKKITTNVSRVRKLLINETDIKNIPEHMKSLAREMLEKIVDNDLIGRKISGIAKQDLLETKRVLNAMTELDGGFSLDDLRLITDEEAQAMVADALADLEDGIGFYNNKASGDLMTNLQAYHNALERISDAVSTITSVINAERSISFMNRRMDVSEAAEDVRRDFGRSRFKGEYAGFGRKARNAATSAVFYGNMTPVYYFKMLRNSGMDLIWEDMQQGENRSGLETNKAREYLQNLAQRTNYKSWADQKSDVVLGGMKRSLTIENMMELYAIWMREKTTNPEMSQHLAKGGVFIQNDDAEKGKPRRENMQQRAVRVSDEEITAMYAQMTDEQKAYIEGIVRYLSNEMSDLGNEASMRMYGIEKYKEKYYFPMKVWDGVKSARSDRGISGTDENRAAHRSWSKRRTHMASNALVIGNFTQDAVNHIVEMINYNTMAPAIENMNKVLNYQFAEGETQDDMTKRNLRVMFEETYGREALKYLETFMRDLNGGVTQDQRKTLHDAAIAMFKKNAVAGSMSVAMQQPLSYIRAAMVINPKYLAQALSPAYWKGSYAEMTKYSGVAVIKDMGRFDMNFGQSAKDYITPETKSNVYEKISDVLTMAPQMMDRMTWTRMWSAVKAEQAALNKGADITSEAFLRKVADRFNEVMRTTQVYDSVMVKSSNMRSQKWQLKMLTSFMAEPTLSLNVLADAVGKIKAGDKGAIGNAAKAGATFLLSAVMQAVVKGLFGSGRTPDEKKTWEENFLYKLQYNLMNEANPFSLIPGYSDLVELMKNGELSDDAMGAIGKIFAVWDTVSDMANGKGRGWYRDIEDTAGQLSQLFTNVPLKNLMRDARAMYNWIVQDTYAKRDTSGAVLKYQAIAGIHTADSLLGALNKKLGEAGYSTANAAYYRRLYNAEKNKDTKSAEGLREYLKLAKGVSEDTITTNMKSLTKDDDQLTESQKIASLRGQGMKDSDIAEWITKQYKEGKLTKDKAVKLFMEANPAKTADDAYFHFEQLDWEKETGYDLSSDTDFFRLDAALDNGNSADYNSAVKELKEHGYKEDKITEHATDRIMKKYRDGEATSKDTMAALKQYGKLSDDDAWWKIDRADYKKQTGAESVSGYYYRLEDAVNANKSELITKAVKDLLQHGISKDKIKNKLSAWKSLYLAADGAGKVKIKDALTKAYKAAGYTAADADKTINSWLKEKKKKN